MPGLADTSAERIVRGTLPQSWEAQLDEAAVSVGWSTSGNWLAAASANGDVCLFEASSGREIRRWPAHRYGANAIAWHPQEDLLASAGQDARAALWHPDSDIPVAVLDCGTAWVEHLAWSPSGRYLATACGRSLRLWSSEGGLVQTFEEQSNTIAGIDWRFDSAELVSACYGRVVFWAPEQSSPKRILEWKGWQEGKCAWKKKRSHRAAAFSGPPGSGTWWINYYRDGKQHRERVGNKGAAIKLYRKRRTEILEGRKLPELKRTAPVVVAELADDVVTFTRNHNASRDYVSKAKIIKASPLGSMNANKVTAESIRSFLQGRCEAPGTWNRYLAFLGLAFRPGIDDGKVTINNPARVKGLHRQEPPGRLRFLSREEYDALHGVIRKRFPEHLAEYVVSVHTGMRQKEQHTVEVMQFDQVRRAIDLDRTKNGSARTVHLNDDAFGAIESAVTGRKRSERIFPRQDRTATYPDRKQERFDNRSWFDQAVKEAKIPRITWHNLRHTFCSWLAMAGATTREVMEAAGHKTIAMAARYTHLSPQHTRSVVDRIASTSTKETNMHQNMHQNMHRAKPLKGRSRKPFN